MTISSGINSRDAFRWNSRQVVLYQTHIMARISFVAVCLCAVAAGSLAAKIPSKWEKCHLGQPDVTECLSRAVTDAVKSMKNGERSLGIGPLDPLRVSSLHIGQGSGPVAIELDFNDLDFKGVGDVKIKNANYDPATNKITANMEIPTIILDGKYKIQGKVLVLPIRGSGNCLLELDQVTGRVMLDGKAREENGKKYMDIEKFDFQFEPKKMKFNFENLFEGNKELGDNMNKFLNENYAVVLNELKPAISEAFGLAFKQISNQVFSKIPIDDIFPQ